MIRAVHRFVSLLPTGSNSPVSMTRNSPPVVQAERVDFIEQYGAIAGCFELADLGPSAPVNDLCMAEKALSTRFTVMAPHGTVKNGPAAAANNRA